MTKSRFAVRKKLHVPCTIEIENTFESLHAHVDLDGDLAMNAGDEVLVHGEPVRVPYGAEGHSPAVCDCDARNCARSCMDAIARASRTHRTLRSQLLIWE